MSRKSRWSDTDRGRGIREVELTSWKYFSDLINTELLEYTNFIYRGHGDKKWLLEPTIDRIDKKSDLKLREDHLNKFKLATRGRRGKNPIDFTDENEWWALGQHHGLLTPLLDWSESPFVSLYFAAVECIKIKSDFLSVFCLCQTSVNDSNKDILEDDSVIAINGKKPTVDIFHPRGNENSRLVNQRGLFTRGPDNIDIEAWLLKYERDDKNIHLMK